MDKKIYILERLLFIVPLIVFLCFSKVSSGQCVGINFDNCPTLDSTAIITSNTSFALWTVIDPSAATIVGPYDYSPSQSITFDLVGEYRFIIQEIGSPCQVADTFAIIIDSIPLNIQTLNAVTLCEGDLLDTTDINLSISNGTGNLFFTWETQPNNYIYSGISTLNIPNTETSILLTVTDQLTGCADTSNISLNYISTNIQPPIFSYTPNNACAGTPIECIVTNSNNLLYNYIWEIQDDIYFGDSITAILSPVLNDSVPIIINITEINNGCEISFFDTINIGTTPIITLDTNYTAWDVNNQGFILCNGNYISSSVTEINLQFNSTISVIDSIIINWGDGIDETLTQPYNLLNHGYNNANNYVLTLSPYYNGCSFTTAYNVLGGSSIDTINGGGLQYLTQTACQDSSTWFYLNDQNNNPIINIGPNDSIIWTIYCDYPHDAEIIRWAQADLDSNLSFLPNNIFSYQIPVLQHDFNDNSCGCNPPLPGNEQYYITAEIIKYCSVNNIGFATFVTIEAPVDPIFSIPDTLCEGEPYHFQNNASSGCDGQSLSAYSDSVFFTWNFGDCIIRDTSTASYPFPDIWHSYELPGTYDIVLNAESYCGSASSESIIIVMPLPNVSFTTTEVCLNDTNFFTSITSLDLPTTRIDICSNGDTNEITVPGGAPIQTYEWSMNNNEGTYLSGTSSSSPNPEFVFNSPGSKVITLTVGDGTCENSYSDTLQVFGLPIPEFSTGTVCAGDCSPILDQSISADYPIENWYWDLGDGTSYNLNYSADTCHIYNQLCTNPDNFSLYDMCLENY